MPWIISNGKSYVEIIGNNQMITTAYIDRAHTFNNKKTAEKYCSLLPKAMKNLKYRDYPEFCVTAKMRCKIELIFQGGSGVGCARLVYNITPTKAEVKGHPRPLGSRRRRSAP